MRLLDSHSFGYLFLLFSSSCSILFRPLSFLHSPSIFFFVCVWEGTCTCACMYYSVGQRDTVLQSRSNFWSPQNKLNSKIFSGGGGALALHPARGSAPLTPPGETPDPQCELPLFSGAGSMHPPLWRAMLFLCTATWLMQKGHREHCNPGTWWPVRCCTTGAFGRTTGAFGLCRAIVDCMWSVQSCPCLPIHGKRFLFPLLAGETAIFQVTS